MGSRGEASKKNVRFMPFRCKETLYVNINMQHIVDRSPKKRGEKDKKFRAFKPQSPLSSATAWI